MGEQEKKYTYHIGINDLAIIRGSFLSMLSHTELTDCVLVCHQSNERNANTNTTDSGVTGIDADNNSNGSSLEQQTTGHNAMSGHIKAHRVILSASSDFFRQKFVSETCVPDNNGVVAVVIDDIDFEDLDAIVKFIYNGQVSVGQSRIHKFLAAAQLLSIKGLMKEQEESSGVRNLLLTQTQPMDLSKDNQRPHSSRAYRGNRTLPEYINRAYVNLDGKYECEICGKTYKLRGNLINHHRNKHQNK